LQHLQKKLPIAGLQESLYSMLAHYDPEQNGHECFVCSLDQQSCAVPRLEGYIIHAHEFKSGGETIPSITISLGTELASVSLTHHYRSLVQRLTDLGDNLHKRKLRLRVFHLPPATGTAESKGRTVHRYRANDYTLAILEPDTILNITDLNHAEYCARQYLLQRLTSSPQSTATIRGNLVHSSFKELLKEYDRGELMTGYAANGEETPLATLYRHFEQALESSSIDLALINTPTEAIRTEVMPHLESLATWFEKQRTTLWDMPATVAAGEGQADTADEYSSENLVRAETFLLAPEIGLRGRLDLLWRHAGRQRLLELKTSGATGELPKPSHKWQVQGYHALLAVRRDPRLKKALATLLYSGTPREAQDFGIRATENQLQRVIEKRNILVLSHVTGIPPAPPGPSRCTKCAMLAQCEQVSSLLNWRPPERELEGRDKSGHMLDKLVLEPSEERRSSEASALYSAAYTSQDREFFAKYYKLLHLEGLEGEKQQALLWQIAVNERVERGTAICDLVLLDKAAPTGQGEWQQTFRCTNTSELREGDEILLSDGNPITGEVVTGTILSISSEQVTVWSPELIAHPRLIDRYDNSIVHVRTLQNLLRWLQAEPHLRGLVAGTLRPRFNMTFTAPPRADFNVEQNLAVQRAMQMHDYLLIHGPPGTGKTSVIAEIVKRLCQQGQRVLLAAFTNQAVDNMLKRLDAEGLHDFVRLGNERSVDNTMAEHLLKKLVKQKQGGQIDLETRQDSFQGTRKGYPHHEHEHEGEPSSIDTLQAVHELLRNVPVIASTTATWSSEKYSLSSLNGIGDNHKNALLQFDVAIIDEAGQLTIPAILGALCFAKRFILVGDEKQLPPLVLSKEAADAGLAESLFSVLKRLDDDYTNNHSQTVSACVPLKVQYRMNKWISHFASKVFYTGQLIPHTSVANRVLGVTIVKPGLRAETPSITRAIDPLYPMVFLDVRSEHEKAKISDAEACTVREVVAGLLVRGIAQEDIGIIAPYRAQVANLRRHLFKDDGMTGWQALPPDTPLSVDTVDRFQGGERPVIIMSFATTTTPEAESQLREHLTDQHRLNVALTRAQRKLILVGCAPALESLPVFQRLLTYCLGMNSIIPHEPAPWRG
jgi:DNA replication ATP-dependent helicase Dna2